MLWQLTWGNRFLYVLCDTYFRCLAFFDNGVGFELVVVVSQIFKFGLHAFGDTVTYDNEDDHAENNEGKGDNNKNIVFSVLFSL